MNNHVSQTLDTLQTQRTFFNPLWINTALKPNGIRFRTVQSFNPLWINTALKPLILFKHNAPVSIPYGLTLLSNQAW